MALTWNSCWSSVILKMINSFQLDEGEIQTIYNADELKILPYIIRKIFTSKGRDLPTDATTKELKDIFITEYFVVGDENSSLDFNTDEDNLTFLTVLLFITFGKCNIPLKDLMNTELDEGSEKLLVKIFKTLLENKMDRFSKNDVVNLVKKCLSDSYPDKIPLQLASSSPATPTLGRVDRREFTESPSLKVWRENIQDQQINALKLMLEEKEEEEEKINETIHALQKEVTELKIKLNEKVKENIKLKEDLNSKLNSSYPPVEETNELVSLRVQLKDLTTELELNKSENDHLSSEKESLFVKNAALNREIEKLQSDLQNIIKQKDKFENTVSAIKKENETLAIINTDLKQEVEQLRESKSDVNNSLNYSTPLVTETCAVVIEKQLNEKQEDINELHAELATLKADHLREISELRELQAITVEEKDREISSTVKDTQKQIAILETTVKVKVKQIEKLEKSSKIKECQEHISQLSSQLRDTSNKLIATKKKTIT